MNKNSNKIGILTLGCSKNTVDSERLAEQLQVNKFKMVDNPEEADTVIINTCGFIEEAREESVNTVLNAIELKKSGKLKKVIVAGCLSERYEKELKEELPEVDSFFGVEKYEEIVKELGGDLRKELLGERKLSTPSHFAYLKISEGCDNPCSFCSIPLMRGKHASRDMESLLKEAESLAEKGVKELIIIGQDTTDYGKDIYGRRNLAELLRKLSDIKNIEWIRLMYAYPSHFPDDIIIEIAENPKICKYIDIPLQHISDKMLKSMRRGITSRRTRELLHELRRRIPGLTLRTTFITGYPGETEEDFDELINFVKEIGFERLGVFTYSVEESTPAYILGDTVPQEIKEERRDKLMQVQQEISYRKNEELIGREIKALIDEEYEEYYVGRSERDAPEVDGEVIINKGPAHMKTGEFYMVEITDCGEYDLFGKFKNY